MKKLLTIILLGVTVTGCTVIFPKKQAVIVPEIGMNETDFKKSNRYIELIYLAKDTSVYKLSKYVSDRSATSNFYHFTKNKLFKFEQKTHYFNITKVAVEDSKEKKTD